jgi:hypothetical protein
MGFLLVISTGGFANGDFDRLSHRWGLTVTEQFDRWSVSQPNRSLATCRSDLWDSMGFLLVTSTGSSANGDFDGLCHRWGLTVTELVEVTFWIVWGFCW